VSACGDLGNSRSAKQEPVSLATSGGTYAFQYQPGQITGGDFRVVTAPLLSHGELGPITDYHAHVEELY
jgi:hypothetical protein